jgi:hypothetical protein
MTFHLWEYLQTLTNMKRFLKISSYVAFVLAIIIVGTVSIPSSMELMQMKPQVAHAEGLGSLVSSSANSFTAAVSNAVAPLISSSPAAAPITTVTPAAVPSVPAATPVTTTVATPVATVTAVSPASTDQTASAYNATFSQKALSTVASIAGLSASATAAKEATSSASSTITMGAAAIINDTFGSPALVQSGTVSNPQSIYTERTTLPLHQTLAWLCLSLAFFVIGIVCIRRDKMPFGAYSISPSFARNPAAIR